MQFKEFLEAFSSGIVPEEHRLKLNFDEYDKSLYNQFSGTNAEYRIYLYKNGIKPSKVLAAVVILARYGYLRQDPQQNLQQKAEEYGVYFKDVNENIPGSPGILVIKGKDIQVNTFIGNLRTRISNLIPLLTRWGSKSPSTTINLERLNNGIWLNYHAKGQHKTDAWKQATDNDTGQLANFESEKDFINNMIELKKDLVIPTTNSTTRSGISTFWIRDKIIKCLNQNNLPASKENILTIAHYVYVKLGAIVSKPYLLESVITLAIHKMLYDTNKKDSKYTKSSNII